MARRFQKNNIISDTESEEEDISYQTSDESDLNSSGSLIKSCHSESSDSNSKAENQSSQIETNVKNLSKSSITTNQSHDGTLAISSSNESEISIVEKELDEKNNSKNNSSKSSKLSVPTKISGKEEPVNVNGDVLVVDSSLSIDGESIICSSTNVSIDKSVAEIRSDLLKKSSSANAKEVQTVVEESDESVSSDSDESVEFIDSVTSINSLNSDISCAPKSCSTRLNISSEVAVLENSFQSNTSLKNSSNVTIDNSSSLSNSGISEVSTASTKSTDERKALEQQLADKRTAYQNILRAVKYCDPNRLKDGGKLLREKLALCKEEVNELKEKLREYKDVSSDKSVEKFSPVPNPIFSTTDQVTSNLGKKGMETHRVHQALTVDSLVTLHNSIETCPAENVQEKDPEGLKVELMPHQRYALAWLLWREQQIPAGGILADDMGLGKTLTMISLVLRSNEYKKERNIEESKDVLIFDNVKIYPGKTLVVCPSSLIGQWQGQIKQHCKRHSINSLIHHGKPRELQAKKLAAFDIVITSYGVVVEENKIVKGNQKGALLRVKWERVIIDEGHVIRNHKTKTAQALCELYAKYRWCLTGTPVQNRELDMYSLLKFLQCSPFDNLTVWKRWVDNKSTNGTKRLNTILKSILLRRTKENLKNMGELNVLPNKTLIPVHIELDEEEEKVYHTVLRFSKNLLAEYLAQEGKKIGVYGERLRDEHRRLINAVNEIKTTEIFVLLLRLRQICCLPGLIHSMLEKDSCQEDGIDVEDDPILQDLTKHMNRMSVSVSTTEKVEEGEEEKTHKILIKSNPVFDIGRPSAKIRAVVKIIQEALNANDKIVVVSQWANFLKKIKKHIECIETGSVMLDGSVPVKLRTGIIDEFNNPDSDVNVMLLSLTAGGVGLNLVGGNRLIIIEPHWNPQLESQACDRIYRVGQKKDVLVYKIICKNTIEEKIELLQQKKLMVAETVLKGELDVGRHKMTLADLKILFDVAH